MNGKIFQIMEVRYLSHRQKVSVSFEDYNMIAYNK